MEKCSGESFFANFTYKRIGFAFFFFKDVKQLHNYPLIIDLYNYITFLSKMQSVSHADTYLSLSVRINIESNIFKYKSSKFSRKNADIFDTDAYLIPKNNKKSYNSRL